MPVEYYFIPPVLILIWVIVIYNNLVKTRQMVRESWSGIDTELKRRYELIPNLVEVVKGYAAHEKDLFETVTEARNKAAASNGDARSQALSERKLVDGVRQLLAVQESYPELKASQHYLELQAELSNTEDRIQAARRFFNANVRDLNTLVESFPTNALAGAFNFEKEPFFEVEKAVIRDVVNISFTDLP
ncbi:MAG: LemA family protein [bacterium]|nr:LemA family protein [bacterium]